MRYLLTEISSYYCDKCKKTHIITMKIGQQHWEYRKNKGERNTDFKFKNRLI